MKAMVDNLKEQLTRRRALLITPFAFGALYALAQKKEKRPTADPNEEITIIQFTDAGGKIGPEKVKRVVHSDSEWRKLLTAQQFHVTRKEGTDTPFTGTYYNSHQAGLFRCVCCGTPLFSSETKFDSGTGWPSFWTPIAKRNIRTNTDKSMFVQRRE